MKLANTNSAIDVKKPVVVPTPDQRRETGVAAD
jgi:hypothetical protein